jgi:hypothetical protein
VRNGSEDCDGGDLGGTNCVGLGYASGTLHCSSSCTYDESACVAVPNPLVVCHSPNLTIPDNDLTGAVDTITIAESGTVTDVNVYLFATHGWVGDVWAELSHDGLYRALIDQPGVPSSYTGCSGDNIDATLDDEASALVENACNTAAPAVQGSLRPNEALAGFDGQSMSGPWEMYIADLELYLGGTFVQWCIEISWQ